MDREVKLLRESDEHPNVVRYRRLLSVFWKRQGYGSGSGIRVLTSD
jgi:hypothetical protein